MAVYRLHRNEWEKGGWARSSSKMRKRRNSDGQDGDMPAHDEVRGGDQRKGISSGRSIVVKKHFAPSANGEVAKNKWWQQLGSGTRTSKGALALSLPKQAG